MSMSELKYITTKQLQYYGNKKKKKKKKFKKHHINTTTQEHQIFRGKPSSVEGKTTGQLRKLSTLK